MSDQNPESFQWESLIQENLTAWSFDKIDEHAGEITERLLARSEAYWKARTNDIFVRNRPEIIQDLARLDATNLQTLLICRKIEAAKNELLEALKKD